MKKKSRSKTTSYIKAKTIKNMEKRLAAQKGELDEIQNVLTDKNSQAPNINWCPQQFVGESFTMEHEQTDNESQLGEITSPLFGPSVSACHKKTKKAEKLYEKEYVPDPVLVAALRHGFKTDDWEPYSTQSAKIRLKG